MKPYLEIITRLENAPKKKPLIALSGIQILQKPYCVRFFDVKLVI